jgi:branched-chain amino acid transport system substrate-binding protein
MGTNMLEASHVSDNQSANLPGWRFGVLFSRQGVTAVTETEHFYGTVLAIEEINAQGGVLGRRLDPVVYDPKDDPEEYRRLAARMLLDDDLDVIFGCSTSWSRKAVLPVVERTNALLWYCSIYEGFEYSPNVIYTGAVPNQNSMQLAAYLLKHNGKRFFLVGADYIYPRESNRIMREMVEQHGGEILDEIYLPSDASEAELTEVLRDIKPIEPDVVFSTLIGTGARRFYKLYQQHGLGPNKIPIASLTMAETETRLIGSELCEGHITSATYFDTLDNESNQRFMALWRSRFGDQPTACGRRWPTTRYIYSHALWSAPVASTLTGW